MDAQRLFLDSPQPMSLHLLSGFGDFTLVIKIFFYKAIQPGYACFYEQLFQKKNTMYMQSLLSALMYFAQVGEQGMKAITWCPTGDHPINTGVPNTATGPHVQS